MSGRYHLRALLREEPDRAAPWTARRSTDSDDVALQAGGGLRFKSGGSCGRGPGNEELNRALRPDAAAHRVRAAGDRTA